MGTGSAHFGFGQVLSRMIDSGAMSASTVEVDRREVIYGCLNRDRTLYLVDHGQLKSTVPSRDGKECLLSIYTAGDVFGELSPTGPDHAQVETVTAMSRATLLRMSAQQVLAEMSNTGLREEFLRYLTARLMEQQVMITGLVTQDSEFRLASALLNLGHKLGKREGHLLRIEERITQEEFSAMVGTTRSRVGFFLKRFRKAGLVDAAQDCFMVVHEERMRSFITGGVSAGAA